MHFTMWIGGFTFLPVGRSRYNTQVCICASFFHLVMDDILGENWSLVHFIYKNHSKKVQECILKTEHFPLGTGFERV